MGLYTTYFIVGVTTVVVLSTILWIINTYGSLIYKHTLGRIPWNFVGMIIAGILLIFLSVLICGWIGMIIWEYLLPFIGFNL